VCGDIMTLYLAFDGGKVKDASFKTMGCGAAIASGSILTEVVRGKSVGELEAISADTLVKALGGLPAIKMHCPELAIEALHAALKDHARRAAPNPVG